MGIHQEQDASKKSTATSVGQTVFTTQPQVGGIIPVGRSAFILWSRCRCLLDTTASKEYNNVKVQTKNVVQLSKVSRGSGRSPVVGQLPSKVKPKANDQDKEDQIKIPYRRAGLLTGVGSSHKTWIAHFLIVWCGIDGTVGVPAFRRIQRCVSQGHIMAAWRVLGHARCATAIADDCARAPSRQFRGWCLPTPLRIACLAASLSHS